MLVEMWVEPHTEWGCAGWWVAGWEISTYPMVEAAFASLLGREPVC